MESESSVAQTTETHRRAALAVVDQILGNFDAIAPKVGDRKGWRKFETLGAIDPTALRQLAGYLRDLGLVYHALPLVKLDHQYTHRLVGSWLSDDAIRQSPEEIAKNQLEFGPFPLPLDDPKEQRRVQREREEQILGSVLELERRLRSVREVLIDLGSSVGDAGAGDTDDWTLAKASRETDVPSWAFTRAANKAKDKPGHLPTRRVGSNRYVTREHAQAFARDYDARREQQRVGSKSKDGRNIVAALKEIKKTSRRSTERKSN